MMRLLARAARQLVIRGRPRGAERGDTLLEVLLAVAILGIAGTAIMTGFGTSIAMSDVHRKLTSGAADSRNYGELLVKAVDGQPSAYQACVDPISGVTTPSATILNGYRSTVTFTPSANNTIALTAIGYWNGTSFVATCPAVDKGLQRVTVAVTSTDNRAGSTVQVVIRKPCLLADVTAGPCT
jgi:prepilin-type N-terminal cleavage/methylation domain-containing protein